MTTVTFGLVRRRTNEFGSWVVGCDVCKRRMHVDNTGRFYRHKKERGGVECGGSFNSSQEFRDRYERYMRFLS